MALSQSIVWTTLPAGRVRLPSGEKGLRFSVYVSPRLTPTAAQVLKPFRLFLDWPSVAAALRLKVVFDGGVTGELQPWPGEDPLEAKVWKRLFDEDTFVRGHQFTDLKNEVIRSFPAADVYSYVQDIYGETAAQHGAEWPSRLSDDSPLGRLKRDLGILNDPGRRGRMDKILDEALKETKVLPAAPARGSSFASRAQYAFYQARRFYDRPKPAGSNPYKERPVAGFETPPVAVPRFDFHQALTALADYPRLLRRLGLVLDFVWVESAAVPAQGKVRVEVQWGDPHQPPAWHVTDRPPWTTYLLEAETFRARAAGGAASELTRGQLDLREVKEASPELEKKTPYLIAQLDVDGSALKALHTAGSLVRMERPDVTNYRTPTRSDLPALRTSGLGLYRRQRALQTHGQLLRAAQVQQGFVGPTRPTFTAEDFVRGYRIDIWDDVSEEWHSLCLRQGEYRFTKRGRLELTLRDEGYVKGASATRGEDGTPKDLYLHERLASFDGWSLVASRPGKTLAADPTEGEPVVPSENAATEFGLATRFAPPPGTLPRLRYGWKYRMRVRLVDLAGNSVEFQDAGDSFASQPILFARYEPVPSPALLLRARVTEGESLEHLVIRSDYDRTAAAYAADPDIGALLEDVRDRLELTGAARAGYIYLDRNERHLAPPKISQLEAELHGKFDPYIGPGNDHAKGYRLALREAATFLSSTIVNLATGAEEPIPGLDLELVPPTGADPTDLDDEDRSPGDALQQGEYVLHKEAQLTVPYLPDPYAAGVAFVGLPGWPAGEPFIVSFDGDWPEVRPFRLRLLERPGVLSQCTQLFAGPGEPKWDPVERVLTVFQAKGVMTEVRYSSVLPDEEAMKRFGLWKWLEQRGAATEPTQKLIRGGKHWMFTPWRTLMLVHAVQHPLCPPTIQQFSPSRQIGDTHANLRGRWHLSIKSTEKVDVLAAWQEPLDDPAQPTWQVLDRSGHVTELKMNPLYPDVLDVPPPVNPQVPRLKLPLRHEFGDTKHRVVRYRLKGTTRFREYFPVELTSRDAAITRVGAEFTVSVPSSARPAAPRPQYILPTFRWEETPLANNGLIRRRRGNGLRVYLERPWWSSGESERLGVVFKTGAIPMDSPYKPYVTQWGLDPVFQSSIPTPGPTLAAFPLATETRSNVSLEEIGNNQDIFAVAGHAVQFDPERKLWFADLVVHAGASYFPFVRLALARFQPFSIEDCHLSRVVLTDYVQLVPDRTLDVRWVGPNTVRVKIYGPAPTQTFASKALAAFAPLRSGTTTRSIPPPAMARELIAQPLDATKVVQAFRPGALENLEASEGLAINPELLRPKAEDAEPSKRLGLNEYTVSVEQLPEGGSEDFGWENLSGVTVTKPLSTRPLASQTRAAATRTARTTSTTRTRASSTAAAASVVAAAGGRATSAVGAAALETAVSGALTVAPLWEGDINLPPGVAGRRRRFVVRENEVYFKATPASGEFIPVARRLVYADIVQLPAPGA